ncbi:17392_t:CDS:10 [Acaulospora morrowiae]|uniref:17392_t:CDS:1 n=1 Tax=Acaulospora morrowiae TaxID=94023 RepID=A0A9N9FPF9_9GLOM|nr:17392_t:CDS:10 [Acaulospora morrowiae]
MIDPFEEISRNPTRQRSRDISPDERKARETLRQLAVTITMALYIVSLAPLFCWQSQDLISDVLNYFVALAVVFATLIYSLHNNRVSTTCCARIIATSFTIIFYSHVLGSRYLDKNKNDKDFNVGGGVITGTLKVDTRYLNCSYIVAGRKFGRVTAALMIFLFVIETFWPAMMTIPSKEIPRWRSVSLIISIIMFSISAAFSKEREISSTLRTVKADVESQAKTTFMQMISHEIRTPIHGILASTEILCETPLSSAQRALIRAIQNAGINVLHMADHALYLTNEWSQDAGLITINPKKFDLYLLSEQVCDGMELLFEVQGIDFDFNYQVPFSQSICVGDVGVIKQTIINSMGILLNIFLSGKVLLNVRHRGNPSSYNYESCDPFLIFEIVASGDFKNTEFIHGNSEIKFLKTIIDAIGGTFAFTNAPEGQYQNTSTSSITFNIELPIEFGITEDEQNENNLNPLPLRYVKIQAQADIDHLKVGVVRSGEDSEIVKRVIAFLNEFGMRSYTYTFPDVIRPDEVNTIILDSSSIRAEQIHTIFKIVKENNTFIICLTFLLKHVEISEKIGLLDKEVYFINQPLTAVKLRNALIAAANEILSKQRKNL